jgi:Ca-activated chloride channel family protein
MRRRSVALVAGSVAAAFLTLIPVSAQRAVFRAGVDVVQVAATVTDDDGRFISGLTRDDFIVYDDGKPQEIETFSSERLPVSLAVLLDVSVSMTDDQLVTARAAIGSFISLLGDDDELFLMEFASRGRMLQNWTRDREAFRRALARANQFPVTPTDQEQSAVANFLYSGTAVFDAVATSLGFAAQGVHPKKAVLVISDGVDTSSRRTVKQVQDAIRASEVLVYALGVEGGSSAFGLLGEGGVDARALRKLTDETGGRTEVVKGFKNLDKAIARLAAEFNQQYVISYAAPSIRDGRWHAIKIEVRKKGSKVRARAGYTAS